MIDNPAMTGIDWALMIDRTEADKLMTDLADTMIGTEQKEIDNQQIADKTGTDKLLREKEQLCEKTKINLLPEERKEQRKSLVILLIPKPLKGKPSLFLRSNLLIVFVNQ
jgi:hypothetical protein